ISAPLSRTQRTSDRREYLNSILRPEDRNDPVTVFFLNDHTERPPVHRGALYDNGRKPTVVSRSFAQLIPQGVLHVRTCDPSPRHVVAGVSGEYRSAS